MSDANTTAGGKNSAAILDKNQAIPFTYPDGFKAVANSLQFLPEEEREQALLGLVMGTLLM
jgi:hypothetical protein